MIDVYVWVGITDRLMYIVMIMKGAGGMLESGRYLF